MSGPSFSCRVINLARATDRRAAMEETLAGAGLRADFFPATDGQALAAAEGAERARLQGLVARSPGHWSKPLTWAELGCFLSHRALWQELAGEGEGAAMLVLEDDVEAAPELGAIVGALLSLPAVPPLVRLHAIQPLAEKRLVVQQLQGPGFEGADLCLSFGRAEAQDTALGARHPRDPLGYWLVGLGGYLITPEGARALLGATKEMLRPVDMTPRRHWEHGLAPFVVSPWPLALRADHAAASQIARERAGRADYVCPPEGRGDPARLDARLAREGRRWRDRRAVARARRTLVQHFGG